MEAFFDNPFSSNQPSAWSTVGPVMPNARAHSGMVDRGRKIADSLGIAGAARPPTRETVELDFDKVVEDHYQNLYRFGYSLAKSEADATDLTQQTFYRFATKGHQLRDKSKVKTWLFTTLYREFLGTVRKKKKFQHVEMESAGKDMPQVDARAVENADGSLCMEALQNLEDKYREPLSLFYLQDQSYKEIAGILDMPIGTVMSRLSRGKEQLRAILSDQMTEAPAK